MSFTLRCIGCNSEYKITEDIYQCEKCGDLLEVKFDLEKANERIGGKEWRTKPISVWKYDALIPVLTKNKIVTLNEGGTSLYNCRNLARELKLGKLYLKNEGENPTGSFKDRGMTVGVTRAKELNMKCLACASTGNTSASLAAYAARAGLVCIVLIPHKAIAMGKLAQAMIHGAKVIAIEGNFDDALKIVMEASKSFGLYLLNSINPFRIEGQKTAAFEVCEQLNWHAPDRLIIPVGNAGNISAYWKGFKEFNELDLIDSLPLMTGIQAQGASPIVEAFKSKKEDIIQVKDPKTLATAVKIGNPVNWKKALRAIYESKGKAETVTDEEIITAQKLLARKEGIFVEPASAASVAGVKKLVDLGEIDKDEIVVCVATGHGLKDPDTALKSCPQPIVIEPKISLIKEIIKKQSL